MHKIQEFPTPAHHFPQSVRYPRVYPPQAAGIHYFQEVRI